MKNIIIGALILILAVLGDFLVTALIPAFLISAGLEYAFNIHSTTIGITLILIGLRIVTMFTQNKGGNK